MIRRYLILFISDMKYIVSVPVLLSGMLSPFLLALFLFLLSLLAPGRYYSLTALTLIAAIPIVYGLVFSQVLIKPGPTISSDRSNEPINFLTGRITFSAMTGFVVLIPVIFLTDAVPDQGWLRSIYASVLFAVMAPFMLLLSVCLAGTFRQRIILTLVIAAFLIMLPVGLMLHHPWNYFAFFLPFYWAVWAWVIASPAESLLYGIISLGISAVCVFLLYHHFCRRSRVY